jgi:hypothetical protein
MMQKSAPALSEDAPVEGMPTIPELLAGSEANEFDGEDTVVSYPDYVAVRAVLLAYRAHAESLQRQLDGMKASALWNAEQMTQSRLRAERAERELPALNAKIPDQRERLADEITTFKIPSDGENK